MMDANLKARWVSALRSGEYEQGGYALRIDQAGSSNRYCCLGVLCDTIDPEGWDDGGTYPTGMYPFWNDRLTGESSTTALPAMLAEGIFGPGTSSGYFETWSRSGEQMSLLGMNDSGDFTFDQIADVIENQF